MNDVEMAFNQGCKGLYPGPDVNQRYLYYFLYSNVGLLNSLGTGATFKELSATRLKSVNIPLPPLSEQRRIVSVLDAAFAGLATATASTQKNLHNARELYESLLEDALQNFENCERKSIKDVVTRLTNGYVGATRGIYQESGIPYLLAKHVRNNQLRFDRVTYITKDFNEKLRKSMLKAGDVLLVQSGHIGHSAVVTPEHDGHNCHAMIVITPSRDIDGHFLSLCFNSRGMQESFWRIRSGSTVPHLTCKAVKELTVPVPPLTDQRRTIRAMDDIRTKTDKKADIANRKLAALEELKQSILHRAFRGELTGDGSVIHTDLMETAGA